MQIYGILKHHKERTKSTQVLSMVHFGSEMGVWQTFFFLINLCIYLFLAALGLRCCVLAFSSCGKSGLLFPVVHVLLIAVAFLVAEHKL